LYAGDDGSGGGGVDHLEIALRRQLNSAPKGKSTLKVMNLGYV